MYHVHVLLTPTSDLSLPALAQKIAAAHPKTTLENTGSELILTEGNWDYHIAWRSDESTLQEIEGIVGHISGIEVDHEIRTCDHQLEIWSDTPDPFMQYYDIHWQILEIIRSFHGVYLVDPGEFTLL